MYEQKLKTSRWRAARRLQRLEKIEVESYGRRSGSPEPADIATIIPTYNRPSSLPAAVESALGQTVDDQRVIVVDDGAGVSCALPDDPRLTVVELSRNLGTAGVVRNIGIRLTRSRLLAFLDDDNTWEPNHLELALSSHAEGADLSYSRLRRMDGVGNLVDVLGGPFDRQAMREDSLVDTNVIVVRRDPRVVFSRVPRRRGDFPLEDWELVWRLSRHMEVVHIAEITVNYVRHKGSHYSEWGASDCPNDEPPSTVAI